MHIQIPRKRFTLRMTSLPGILRGGERSCCHGKTRTGGPFPPGDDDGRLALVRRPPCQKAGQRWLDVPGLGPPCGGGVRRGRLQRLGGGSGPLARKGEIWEGFLPDLPVYTSYKYAVRGADGQVRQKADPYGFHTETRPATASKLYDISGFKWTDGAFREKKVKHPVYTSPLNIYEVHLGSWKSGGTGTSSTTRTWRRIWPPM